MKSVKYIVSILIFSGVCLNSSAAAQSAGGGWKWRFKTAESISDVQSDEKTVFIGEYNGNLYALDKRSGRKVWELKGGAGKNHYIRLKQNVLISAGDDGKIRAFAADTRQPLWSRNAAADEEAGVQAVSENSVFTERGFEGLTALDLKTGREQWINRDCGRISTVSIDENRLYVLGAGGNLFALDAATGATVWKYKRHGSFELLATTDKALIFSYSNDGADRQFIAFEKTGGKLLWNEKLDEYDGFHTVYEADRLYLTFYNDPSMLALDAKTGKRIWKIDLPDAQIERDDYSMSNALDKPTIAGDLLYCGGRDGFLYVFEKRTGKQIGKRKISDDDLSSPLIVGETGYVLSRNRLFAVDLNQKGRGGVRWRFSAFGTIFPLKYEADGTLYFESQEHSYNAIDLKSVERLARLKKPLGTRTTPAKTDLDTPVMSINQISRERVDGIYSAPAFTENAAYFTVTNQIAAQGLLYEVNLRNGALRKVSEVKADELSAPKIFGGRAFFSNAPFDEKSARKPFLYAVEIDSGKTTVERQIEPTPQRESAPEIAANLILIAGKDSNLYAYDAAAGEYRWRISAQAMHPTQRYVSADEKSLYLLRDMHFLSAVDLASGKVAWHFDRTGRDEVIETFSEPNEQTILVGTYHDALYSLDKTDGRVVWKIAFGDEAVRHITTAANGATAFVVTEADSSRWLEAVRVADGKILWEKSVGSDAPAYLFGEDVCAADAQGFFCFKQTDGSRTVSYRTDKQLYGFSPNGILLYSTEESTDSRLKTLEGVSLRNGKVLWNINLHGSGKTLPRTSVVRGK